MDNEGQNRLQFRGKAATLAGKPDPIARGDDEAGIIDAKTRQASAIQLEEVVYDPDAKQWRIIFGFIRPWDRQDTMSVDPDVKTRALTSLFTLPKAAATSLP